MVDDSFVPLSKQPSVKYCRLTDFKSSALRSLVTKKFLPLYSENSISWIFGPIFENAHKWKPHHWNPQEPRTCCMLNSSSINGRLASHKGRVTGCPACVSHCYPANIPYLCEMPVFHCVSLISKLMILRRQNIKKFNNFVAIWDFI